MITARKMLGKLFPEQRELIIRSGGQVHYLRVGRNVQVGAVTLAAMALVWTAFSTVQFASHNSIVSETRTRGSHGNWNRFASAWISSVDL